MGKHIPQQLKLFTEEPFVTVEWAARQLKTSRQPIYKLIESGELKAYRLNNRGGGWYRIYYSSFVAYLGRVKAEHNLG